MTDPTRTLAAFVAEGDDGVFYPGHASLLVRLAGRCYLFDYVLNNKPYGDVWRFFPALVADVHTVPLDGIFVSHAHQDHLDIPFLLQMRGVCPLYVLDGRPEFNGLLESSGLQPVYIPPDTRFALNDEVDVYGVLHDSNGVDGSLVIASRQMSVYHGNDNYVGAEKLQILNAMFGGIDVACIPYAYINWYPFLLDDLTPVEKEAEAERLVHHYYDLAIAQADAMGARLVVPFGANLVYYDDAYSPMNMAVKTPIEFESYAHRRLGAAGHQRFVALFGGDTVGRDADGTLRVRALPFERGGYRDMMQVHLQRTAAEEPPAPPPIAVDLDAALPAIARRVAAVGAWAEPHQIRIEARGEQALRLSIDLQQQTVTGRAARCAAAAEDAAAAAPYHLFRVDDGLLGQWLRAEIRFEEIIGSRKFTLSRVPNVYDPEILRFVSTAL